MGNTGQERFFMRVAINRKQTIVLLIGVIAIILTSIYPPWYILLRYGKYRSGKQIGIIYPRHHLGYHALWQPPDYRNPDVKLDFHRLAVEWVIVAATTGGLLLQLSGRRKKQQSGSVIKEVKRWLFSHLSITIFFLCKLV